MPSSGAQFLNDPPAPQGCGDTFLKRENFVFPREFVWARFLFSFVRLRVSATKISGTPFPNLLARRHLVSSKIVPLPESECLGKVGPQGDHNRPQTDHAECEKGDPLDFRKGRRGRAKIWRPCAENWALFPAWNPGSTSRPDSGFLREIY